MSRQTPDGTLWCSTCRRTHSVPVCEVCGVELRDLPHRLVMVCEPCKAAARTGHAGAVGHADGQTPVSQGRSTDQARTAAQEVAS